LVENLKDYPNFISHKKAVWGKTDGKLPFQAEVPLDPTNFGLATTFTHTADTEVDTIGIDNILEELETIRLLKIDTEGAEYPILFNSKLLNKVQEICGEIHDIVEDNHLKLPTEFSHSTNSDDLIKFLETNGFIVETYNPNTWKNCRTFRAVRNG